jgi:hypothetical protein
MFATSSHRFHGDLDASPRGHADNRKLAVDGPDPRDEIESLRAGGRVPLVVQVDQRDVARGRGDGRKGVPGRGDGIDPVALWLEQ